MPAEHLQLQIVDVRPPLSFGDLEVNMRTGLMTGRNVGYLSCVGRGGYLSGPSVIMVHFTAGPGDARKSIQAMNQRRVSSHLVINRDGSIMQGVPFNRVAFHAGNGSWWHFHDNMNSNSIGIELCNLGPLWRNRKRELVDSYGIKRSERTSEWAPHKNASKFDLKKLLDKNYDKIVAQGVEKPSLKDCEWEVFPDEQRWAVQRVCSLLVTRYPSIKHIIGHDDYAPQRKIDPGPALRLESLLSWLPSARVILYQDDHRRPGYTSSLDSTSYLRNLVTSRTFAAGNPGRDIA